MKQVRVYRRRPVKVLRNTLKRREGTYLTIKCPVTGEVLHRGQPEYIRRVLSEKFDLDIAKI